MLLQAARARRVELILTRAGAPAEQLDRRLANVTATIRALGADVVERQVAHPPRWATALLGQRPTDTAKAAAYDTGVRQAARCRVAHGVRDGQPRLGPAPMDRHARTAFQHARAAVAAAKTALGQAPEPPASDVGRCAATARRTPASQLSFEVPPRRSPGVER